MPVKSFMEPDRAFLYNPFGSRFLHSSIRHWTYISTNLPDGNKFLTKSRSSLKGEINVQKTMWPCSKNNFAVSPALRIFSFLSVGEKARSEHKPCRIISPSSRAVRQPRSNNLRSRAMAIVDLPAPETPQNQSAQALWAFRFSRLLSPILKSRQIACGDFFCGILSSGPGAI